MSKTEKSNKVLKKVVIFRVYDENALMYKKCWIYLLRYFLNIFNKNKFGVFSVD